MLGCFHLWLEYTLYLERCINIDLTSITLLLNSNTESCLLKFCINVISSYTSSCIGPAVPCRHGVNIAPWENFLIWKWWGGMSVSGLHKLTLPASLQQFIKKRVRKERIGPWSRRTIFSHKPPKSDPQPSCCKLSYTLQPLVITLSIIIKSHDWDHYNHHRQLCILCLQYKTFLVIFTENCKTI